uniref:Programmed cell death protein 2 C-terminal domain-containing protein n=1 Tax=Glossina brevipalpis TaxID=37001 RepID=A0A1A9WP52_9MUSC
MYPSQERRVHVTFAVVEILYELTNLENSIFVIMETNGIELGFLEKTDDNGWLNNRYFPNKVGGKPAWLHLGDLPDQEKLICQKCAKPKSFLLQLYVPFGDDYNFHRMLYVFVCRSETCHVPNNASVLTVLRSQLPLKNEFFASEPPIESGKPLPSILPKEHKLCLVCGCKSSIKCNCCDLGYYCCLLHRDLHSKVHMSTCSKTSTIDRLSIVEFDEWEIVKESINEDEEDIKKANVLEEEKIDHELEKLSMSDKAGIFQNIPDSELEKYSANSELIDDKFFCKFRKECNKEPEQIIRYKRNGTPLWIADVEKTVASHLKEIPKCEYCGGNRSFEFQIMPQLLHYLNDDSMDWGVIAVYTCSKSCPLPSGVGYVEEFVIKQNVTV